MHRSAFARFPFLRLLLALAIGGLWARSYWRSDLVGAFLHGGKLQVIGSDRGKLILTFTNIDFGPERAFTVRWLATSNDDFDDIRTLLYATPPLPEQLLGVSLGGNPNDPFGLPGARYHFIAIPIAYPAAAVALALALGFRTFWLRRRWGVPGICRACGYDLRASEGRCPECGTAAACPA